MGTGNASVGMDAEQAASFLKQVAEQSFGSGKKEGVDGGHGSVGLIGGKPVKFNTHRTERAGKASAEMIRSSNELRKSLGAAAKALAGGKDSNEKLAAIYKDLGLDSKGALMPQKKLLSRKVAAQVLHQIDDLRNTGVAQEDRVSSFDGIAATSSKGVKTTFVAQQNRVVASKLETLTPQFAAVAEKLGIELDANQMKALASLCVGSNACYQLKNHSADCQTLFDCFRGEELGSFGSNAKGTVAFLQRLPPEKRVDGLFLALAAGPRKLMTDGLNSEATLDEITRQAKGKPINAKTLEAWANGKIKTFAKRYPEAPLQVSDANILSRDLLDTASCLGMLMAIDDVGYSDILKTDESTPVDLASWRKGGGGQEGTSGVIEQLKGNVPFTRLRTMVLSEGLDLQKVMNDYGGEEEGFGLTLAALPPGTSAVDPSMLGEMKTAKDLERTCIVATFTHLNGQISTVDTGIKPKGQAAIDAANNLKKEVNKLLNLDENAPLTSQTRVAMAFFGADGMGATRNLIDEHVARQMSLTREGADLIVRIRNLESSKSGTFDFSVRIHPDGTNRYEHLDVREKPVDKSKVGAADRLARQLVMTWRNTANPETRGTIEQKFGSTYLQQLDAAKKLLEVSPKFVQLCQFQPPSAEQLKAFDANFQKQTEDTFAKKFKTEEKPQGLPWEMNRCFNNVRFSGVTTVQGQSIPQDKNGTSKPILDRIATFVPENEPGRNELTFLLAMGMGLQGPMSQLEQGEGADLTGLPRLTDSSKSGEKLMTLSLLGRASPTQDLSVDGDDYVLTQRYSHAPSSLMMDGVQTGIIESQASSLPSVTFVTQMRVPRNQQLAPGEVPKFTYSTRIEEANTLPKSVVQGA